MKYIHQLAKWPEFTWDQERIATQLAGARMKQGLILGRMRSLGFDVRETATLQMLTEEVVQSSAIEGEKLNKESVRSSVARRLGIREAGSTVKDRSVEGVVEMMLDATRYFDKPLTAERLFAWHGALFPTGRSGLQKIETAKWRTDKKGPMQVVSGAYGHQSVHYEAPDAKRLNSEMKAFLKWFNGPQAGDPVLKAGIAHLWFVTVHPFSDGNGRIARAVTDLCLTRSEGNSQRFYSLSAQIQRERDEYYDVLEETQKGNLDITSWLAWFLGCFERALENSMTELAGVFKRATFWSEKKSAQLNDRQRKIVTRLLEGLNGKLTSSKYAKLAKCSQDTATRDINDLIVKKILKRDEGGGRSTSYSLV